MNEETKKEIRENAEGNIFFFLSAEATAPNNTDFNIDSIIRKAYPIANLLQRHINIYGYNPIEGINFICRVLPGNEVSPDKMVTSEVVEAADPVNMVTCDMCAEDIAYIMKIAGIQELTKAMQEKTEGAGSPGAASPLVRKRIVPKSGFRKFRDKKIKEKEANLIGFDPDSNIFEPATEDAAMFDEIYSSDNDEIKINITED